MGGEGRFMQLKGYRSGLQCSGLLAFFAYAIAAGVLPSEVITRQANNEHAGMRCGIAARRLVWLDKNTARRTAECYASDSAVTRLRRFFNEYWVHECTAHQVPPSSADNWKVR